MTTPLIVQALQSAYTALTDLYGEFYVEEHWPEIAQALKQATEQSS